MDRVYLDYNCFQRSFDDARQLRIQMEALACQQIFQWAEASEVNLVWSFMHEDEAAMCPFPDRQAAATLLSRLCTERVQPLEVIRDTAVRFQQQTGLSAKDAIHVACARHAGSTHFVTCDDRLSRQAERLKVGLAVVNPVDYVRQRSDERSTEDS